MRPTPCCWGPPRPAVRSCNCSVAGLTLMTGRCLAQDSHAHQQLAVQHTLYLKKNLMAESAWCAQPNAASRRRRAASQPPLRGRRQCECRRCGRRLAARGRCCCRRGRCRGRWRSSGARRRRRRSGQDRQQGGRPGRAREAGPPARQVQRAAGSRRGRRAHGPALGRRGAAWSGAGCARGPRRAPLGGGAAARRSRRRACGGHGWQRARWWRAGCRACAGRPQSRRGPGKGWPGIGRGPAQARA